MAYGVVNARSRSVREKAVSSGIQRRNQVATRLQAEAFAEVKVGRSAGQERRHVFGQTSTCHDQRAVRLTSGFRSERANFRRRMRWDWNLVLMSYGKSFTAHRRVVQQEFQPLSVAELHRPVMEREVAGMVRRLLATPEDLVSHLRR